MAINKSDIKLMASQDMSDYSDAGGMMSGNVIEDGVVNNMFADISRLDRVYGRISLRKAFLAVQTLNRDTYYGSHIVLTDPPDDPRIHVTAFTTDSDTDLRSDARNYIENYVVQGAPYPGYLMGDQLQGARAIVILQREELPLPKVGDVLYIVEGVTSQYVRITNIATNEARTYTVTVSNQTTADIKRRYLELSISNQLLYTFNGASPNYWDTAGSAKLYTTRVADSARYYGVKKLAQPITKGVLTFQAESIYTNLVPAAQAESAVVDMGLDGQVVPVASGGSIMITVSVNITTGANIYLGTACVVGSVTMTAGAYTWTDDSQGNLRRNGVAEASINYGSGVITWGSSGVTGAQNLTIIYTPGVKVVQPNESMAIDVSLQTRSYNYTFTLLPTPDKQTVIVDYMANGNWYRLRDNGLGELIPDVPGTGTGIINYTTGSVVLTCGALPDIGSKIIVYWQQHKNYSQASATTINYPFYYHFKTDHYPISPGSISFVYDNISVTDDGAGNLVGVNGKVNYQDGDIYIYPSTIPAGGVDISVPINNVLTTAAATTGGGTGFYSVTMTSNAPLAHVPIKPGSVKIKLKGMSSLGGDEISLEAFDRQGNIFLSETIYYRYLGHDGIPINFLIQQANIGTINYDTGVISIVSSVPVALSHWQYNKDGTVSEPLGQMAISSTIDVTYYSNEADYTTQNKDYAVNSLKAYVEATEIKSPTSDIIVKVGNARLYAKNGLLYQNYDYTTGTGTVLGSITPDGVIILDKGLTLAGQPNVMIIESMVYARFDGLMIRATFRTPGAPLRPGSLYVQAHRLDNDEVIYATADLSGNLSSEWIKGTVNVETGVVDVKFGKYVGPIANYVNEFWYDASTNVGDTTWMPLAVKPETIKYNAVIYSSIPLDANLLGLDPVRLPTDGRVPIYRVGDIIVIHNTQTDTLPTPLMAGQQVTLSRGDLSLVELYDANNVLVPATKYSVNLATGVITMANPLDLSGYTEPLKAMHRREDMCLLSDVQINGQMAVVAPIQHDYEANTTFVSGALVFGDLQARVHNIFDQNTWTNVWSDTRIGDAAIATYDTLHYPITTTNKGAITERWAIIFTSSSNFNVVGEKVGIVATGSTLQDVAPNNPATGEPYFRIQAGGWGTGWATSNTLRFNTTSATAPIWVARTTLQGPATTNEDFCKIQIRGDSN